MTVTSTINRQESIADGSATIFPISDFTYADAADIAVFVVVYGDTVEHGTFAVSDPQESSPSVTFDTAPPDGARVIRQRDSLALQNQEWRDGYSVPLPAHETAHDRRAMVDIDMSAKLARTLRLPDHEAATQTIPMATNRAGYGLAFGENGAPTLSTKTDMEVVEGIDKVDRLDEPLINSMIARVANLGMGGAGGTVAGGGHVSHPLVGIGGASPIIGGGSVTDPLEG